jgi:maltokinase
VTTAAGSLADPGPAQREALARVVDRWADHRRHSVAAAGAAIELVAVEVLVPGRPGVLDVLAEIDGRLAHAVVGLRRPGDETHVLGSVDEPALGLVEDDYGLAVAVDALHDADTAHLLLGVVAGADTSAGGSGIDAERRGGTVHGAVRLREPGIDVVTVVADDDEATTLAFAHRCTLSVFPWLRPGPHPGVAFLAGLDEAGFNHLAAPIAIWRRAGRDLGVVQELLSGTASGWELAQTSLRDLFDTGGPPESAGGDFGPEARALGTMAGRMHLALDRAFGQRPGDLAGWADEMEAHVAGAPPGSLDAAAVHESAGLLRAAGLHPPLLRTHGDFHLGRTARTDHGWVLADCMPGGTDPESGEPVFHSPLADVAAMLGSFRHAADAAAARGPAVGPSTLAALAERWAARNRRSFLAGYLATPGIEGLVPGDRDLVRRAVALFEAVGGVGRSAGPGA